MATTCELTATFEEPLTVLYEQFRDNIHAALRWGTNWDIIREDVLRRADGALMRQVWGFSAAYARMDGMGGHVSFMMQFTEFETETRVEVTVSSPYEKHSKDSAHYRRAHQVALRLMEFSVAPYEEIHPGVNTLKRIVDSVRVKPTESTAT
ncbi:MAG: hypothetical protein AAF787_01700 [Chloroflexota bacterium]